MGRGKRQAQGYLDEIRRAAKKKIIYTEHALNEMHAENKACSCGLCSQGGLFRHHYRLCPD